MKTLETILRILVRIMNVPLFPLNYILMMIYTFILRFIFVPLEFFIVVPIYYLITGNWYYNCDINPPYDYWFPIVDNIGNYVDLFPRFIIPEELINFSKYYGRN